MTTARHWALGLLALAALLVAPAAHAGYISGIADGTVVHYRIFVGENGQEPILLRQGTIRTPEPLPDVVIPDLKYERIAYNLIIENNEENTYFYGYDAAFPHNARDLVMTVFTNWRMGRSQLYGYGLYPTSLIEMNGGSKGPFSDSFNVVAMHFREPPDEIMMTWRPHTWTFTCERIRILYNIRYPPGAALFERSPPIYGRPVAPETGLPITGNAAVRDRLVGPGGRHGQRNLIHSDFDRWNAQRLLENETNPPFGGHYGQRVRLPPDIAENPRCGGHTAIGLGDTIVTGPRDGTEVAYTIKLEGDPDGPQSGVVILPDPLPPAEFPDPRYPQLLYDLSIANDGHGDFYGGTGPIYINTRFSRRTDRVYMRGSGLLPDTDFSVRVVFPTEHSLRNSIPFHDEVGTTDAAGNFVLEVPLPRLHDGTTALVHFYFSGALPDVYTDVWGREVSRHGESGWTWQGAQLADESFLTVTFHTGVTTRAADEAAARDAGGSGGGSGADKGGDGGGGDGAAWTAAGVLAGLGVACFGPFELGICDRGELEDRQADMVDTIDKTFRAKAQADFAARTAMWDTRARAADFELEAKSNQMLAAESATGALTYAPSEALAELASANLGREAREAEAEAYGDRLAGATQTMMATMGPAEVAKGQLENGICPYMPCEAFGGAAAVACPGTCADDPSVYFATMQPPPEGASRPIDEKEHMAVLANATHPEVFCMKPGQSDEQLVGCLQDLRRVAKSQEVIARNLAKSTALGGDDACGHLVAQLGWTDAHANQAFGQGCSVNKLAALKQQQRLNPVAAARVSAMSSAESGRVTAAEEAEGRHMEEESRRADRSISRMRAEIVAMQLEREGADFQGRAINAARQGAQGSSHFGAAGTATAQPESLAWAAPASE